MNKFQNLRLFKFQKRKQKKRNGQEASPGPAQQESHIGGANSGAPAGGDQEPPRTSVESAGQSVGIPIHLDDPFYDYEIAEAFSSLNYNARSGPDGFGPGFFKKFWNLTEPHVTSLFNQIFSLQTDLDSLNRAYLILLQKTKTKCQTARGLPTYCATKLPYQSNLQGSHKQTLKKNPQPCRS
jgi:hypothetical protein